MSLTYIHHMQFHVIDIHGSWEQSNLSLEHCWSHGREKGDTKVVKALALKWPSHLSTFLWPSQVNGHTGVHRARVYNLLRYQWAVIQSITSKMQKDSKENTGGISFFVFNLSTQKSSIISSFGGGGGKRASVRCQWESKMATIRSSVCANFKYWFSYFTSRNKPLRNTLKSVSTLRIGATPPMEQAWIWQKPSDPLEQWWLY